MNSLSGSGWLLCIYSLKNIVLASFFRVFCFEMVKCVLWYSYSANYSVTLDPGGSDWKNHLSVIETEPLGSG